MNGLYFIFNLVLIITWLRVRNKKVMISSEKDTKLTIIIPVRNEAANIVKLLQDIDNQDYPPENFEVIIANDNSTDNTAELVLAFQQQAKYSIRLLNIFEEKGTSPKKRAIQKSIEISSGELLITTDGDCRVPQKWLSSVQQFYQSSDAKLISSPVTFTEENNFWNTAQIIEFASLMGSGACAMYLNKPNMCNGANIAYTREIFEKVGGFAGNEHLASGDDEFLMHKIAMKFGYQSIGVSKLKDTIVSTSALQTFSEFVQQRKRWVSKGKHYDLKYIFVIMIITYLTNISIVICFISAIFGHFNWLDLFIFMVLKTLIELPMIQNGLKFNGQYSLSPWVFVIQPFYIFYVSLIPIFSIGKKYNWKGKLVE